MTRRPRAILRVGPGAAGPESLEETRPGVKQSGCGADNSDVVFERCPYDAHPISAEAFSGGSLMLTCAYCGAAWEAHNRWLRRIIEPDWDEVRAARGAAGVTDGRDRADVEADAST